MKHALLVADVAVRLAEHHAHQGGTRLAAVVHHLVRKATRGNHAGQHGVEHLHALAREVRGNALEVLPGLQHQELAAHLGADVAKVRRGGAVQVGRHAVVDSPAVTRQDRGDVRHLLGGPQFELHHLQLILHSVQGVGHGGQSVGAARPLKVGDVEIGAGLLELKLPFAELHPDADDLAVLAEDEAVPGVGSDLVGHRRVDHPVAFDDLRGGLAL